MLKQYTPSKRLTEAENHELKVLRSLRYAAPLTDESYARYAALMKKAGRTPAPQQ